MATPAASPYEAAIGDGLRALHPRLLAYFSAIPAGHHGHGAGIFDVIGTPRRWLWPALAVLGRGGILFPVWQRGVAFTVINAPVPGGTAAVSAVRRFAFAGGERAMVDEIAAVGGALLDRLGLRGRLVATFDARTSDGSLRLASTRVGVRVRRRTLWLPRRLSPRVTLHERFDDEVDCQRVSVVVQHPWFGRLYEYSGSFRYEIRADEPASPGEGEWSSMS